MKKTLIFLLAFLFLISPIFVFAQPSLIICNEESGSSFTNECGWDDLVQLAQNFIDFLIYLAIPLAALSFSYAGFLIMTAGGNQGQRDKGKDVFVKVAKGLIFMLVAWLIVDLILTALLSDDSYSLLN